MFSLAEDGWQYDDEEAYYGHGPKAENDRLSPQRQASGFFRIPLDDSAVGGLYSPPAYLMFGGEGPPKISSRIGTMSLQNMSHQNGRFRMALVPMARGGYS